LFKAFANIYEPIASFKEIFQLTLTLLKLLPIENYPEELQVLHHKLKFSQLKLIKSLFFI
jgi:hypothetical protein